MKFEISREDIKKLIVSFQKEHEDLGKIIYPILNKFDLEKKEVLEVCQIGKFTQKFE